MEALQTKKKSGFFESTTKHSLQKTVSPTEIALFEELKSIAKEIERFGKTDNDVKSKISDILIEFKTFDNTPGKAFVFKVFSILYEKLFQTAEDLSMQISHLEIANDYINQAVIVSGKKIQPSLLKRQARLKSLLSSCLHQLGDHYNANTLQADASRILGSLVFNYPDYPEGRLDKAAAELRKLPYYLTRILYELEKAEGLFNHPRNKHTNPNEWETPIHMNQISELREKVHELIGVLNK